MEKLVLGILVVILLQIAFLAYTTTTWPGDATASISFPTTSGPNNEVSGVGHTAQLPASTAPASPDIVTSSITRHKTAETSERPRITRRAFRTTRDRGFESAANFRAARVRRPAFPLEQTTMVGPVHSTVLIQYRTRAAETKVVPATLQSKAKPEIKQRRRSFLARTLPAVFKKPWGWIKSLASKID